MTDVVLRDLSASELSGPEVRELLRLATEFDDAGLDRVVSDVLPRLTVLAAIDDGVPVALAAYAPSAPAPGPARPAGPEPDLQPEPATIEYLATAGARRRTGLAGALIAEIRRRHPRAAVRASTDDDAIGFYRATGFLDRPAPADPRWPGRRRYDCVLSPGPTDLDAEVNRSRQGD